jgi:hypothetical protein
LSGIGRSAIFMLRLIESRLFRADIETRMPFRYGIATMTALPHVFLQVRCECDGVVQTGVAADHLPPKWFTKDPLQDPGEEIPEMLSVINRARVDAAAVDHADSPFAFWRNLWEKGESWGRASGLPPLLVHFGTSLVERAIIDAFCRSRRQNFASALRENSFGIELGSIHAVLAGTQPADWLRPSGERVFARHTVGLTDPLTEAEIAPAERLDDGLPQSLEACIRAYGLRHFKLKFGGPNDLARLRSIAALLAVAAPADYACSLDGNEGFHDVSAFRDFWGEFARDPALENLRSRLLFVEQPFHRAIALSAQIDALANDRLNLPPIVIDESDASLTSLPEALALGYSGTTHKNCKGVFKGVANACLISQRRLQEPSARWSLSGEDLTNIGPVALLQDLAVQAALGVTSVERNGHHYFAGLSIWPQAVQEAVRRQHADLYRDSPRGWPTVRIEDGRISLKSVVAAPFGVGFDFDPSLVANS